MSHHLVSRVRAALVQKPRVALIFALAAIAVLFFPTPAAAQCAASREMLTVANPPFAVGAAVVHNDGSGDAIYVFSGYTGKMARSRNLTSWEYFSLNFAPVSPVSFGGEIIAGPDAKAWDGVAWRELPGLSGGVIRKLVVVNGRAYAIGTFVAASAQTTAGLAYWDGSAWNALNVTGGVAPVDITVYQGRVAIIGNFTTIAGQPCAGVAFFDGTAWTTPAAGAPAQKKFCVGIGGDLYLTASNGHTFGRPPPIVRWNGASWAAVPPPTSAPFADFFFLSGLDAFGNSLLLSGDSVDRGTEAIVLLYDGSTWSVPISCRTGAASAFINVAIPFANELLVLGSFDSVNMQPITCAARWNGSVVQPAYAPVNRFAPHVLAEFNGEFIVGGANIARIVDAQLVTLGGGVNGNVTALSNNYSELYVGGTFTQSGDVLANHIAKWNGSIWAPLGTATENGVDGPVYSLELASGARLFVGGEFETAGELTNVGNIAIWNDGTWERLGNGVNGPVRAIQMFHSEGYIVIAGSFSLADGVPVAGVARWDGTWAAMGVGHNFDRLAFRYTEMFASTSDVADSIGVYRWDGNSWIPDAPSNVLGRVVSLHAALIDGEVVLFAMNDIGTLWRRSATGDWKSTPYGLDHIPAGFWPAPPSYSRSMSSLSSRAGKLYMAGDVSISYTLGEFAAEFLTTQGAITEITLSDDMPQFTQQPADATVDRLSPVTLSSAVEPQAGPVAFQWYHDGLPVAGGTAAVLLIEHAGAADAGEYYVVASNLCGAATSDAVTVTVTGPCTEDINGDQVVDLGDLAQLLAGYGLCDGAAGFDPAADVNQSGCVDLSDLAILLAVFGVDC